jgi:hypothetical protein
MTQSRYFQIERGASMLYPLESAYRAWSSQGRAHRSPKCGDASSRAFVAIRRSIGQERSDLPGGRGQADQVEARTAEHRGRLGLRRGSEPRLFEAGQDEAIDGIPDPTRVPHLGRPGPTGREESPVRGRRRHARDLAGHGLRPLVDPVAEQADLGLAQWGTIQGHPLAIPLAAHGEDHGALVAMARHDRGTDFAPLECLASRVEPETAASAGGPMTCHAVPGEERLDLSGIVDLRRRRPGRRLVNGPGRATDQHRKAHRQP